MLTKKEKSNHERFPYKWIFLTPPVIITYIALYFFNACVFVCYTAWDYLNDTDHSEPNKTAKLRETLLDHERTFTAAVCILGIALTILSAIQ